MMLASSVSLYSRHHQACAALLPHKMAVAQKPVVGNTRLQKHCGACVLLMPLLHDPQQMQAPLAVLCLLQTASPASIVCWP